MAAKKISQLTAATASADTDQFAVNQGGTSKRVTRSQVLARKITGTVGAPLLLSTVTVPITAGMLFQMLIVAGDSGALVANATPQIAAGTIIGQRLLFRGTNDTNTYTLGSGDSAGIKLNGISVLRNYSTLELVWDGTLWLEVARNDI